VAKKLKNKDDIDITTDVTISYRILNFCSVFMVLSDYVVRKKCGGNITFSEKSARGLGFQLVIQCAVCKPVNINSCPLIDNRYEINKRFVFVMRMLGLGLAGGEKFCAFMDLLVRFFIATMAALFNLYTQL